MVSLSHSFTGESSVEEIWEESEPDDDITSSTDDDLAPTLPEPETASATHGSQKSLIFWLVGFLLQLQSKHNIPDRAVDLLFKFLYIYFSILGRFSQFMAIVASHFPSTLYCVKKTFLEAQHFTCFVVCRKCWKLYHFGECIFTSGTIKSSKECIFVQFPHHPYTSGRVSCKQKLLKSVKVSSGKTIFYSFRLYCYKSLQSSLQNLLLRPRFIESCEH